MEREGGGRIFGPSDLRTKSIPNIYPKSMIFNFLMEKEPGSTLAQGGKEKGDEI
jgi:hypothetical protein